MVELLQVQYVYITIAIAAILLNTTVLYLYMTRKYLRKALSNIFLVSLAISDFCYASIAIPLLITCELTKMNRVCYPYDYVLVYFGYSTVYHILLAITEKFCAICFVLKHLRIMTRSLAIKLSLSVWLLSIIITHIPAWWDYILPVTSEEQNRHTAVFYKFHFATGFFIPALMSAIMYSLILRKLFKITEDRLSENNDDHRARTHAEKKAVLTFAIMLAAFLFSWSTWFIARINTKIVKSDQVYHFLTISKLLDPIFNPILYSFLKKDFRRAFRSLFCKKNHPENTTIRKRTFKRAADHGTEDFPLQDAATSTPVLGSIGRHGKN